MTSVLQSQNKKKPDWAKRDRKPTSKSVIRSISKKQGKEK